MKTKTIQILFSFLIFGLLTSCCTIFHGATQMVDVSSEPVGAKISIDGRDYGTTPLSIPLNRQGRLLGESKEKKGYLLKIELEGYLPYEIMLRRKMDKLFLVDFIGSAIGIILDARNGAMYKLTPDQINAKMGKTTASSDSNSENVYIAVTLNPDPSWEKIGNLKKIKN